MDSSQITYYNSLPEESKKILQAAALCAVFSIDSALQDTIYAFLKRKATQKEITLIIQAAVKNDLFIFGNDWRANYTVTIEFLVFIFPEIDIDAKILERICSNNDDRYGYYLGSTSSIKSFRNCLYMLLYASPPERYKYKEYESKLLLSLGSRVFEYYEPIFEDERYEKKLSLISEKIIYNAIVLLVSNSTDNLIPHSETFAKIERLEKLTDYPLIKISQIELSRIYWSGNLEKAIEVGADILMFNALKCLTDGDIVGSITLFNKLIKEQHKSGNKSPLPEREDIAYFYVLALLLSDTLIFTPVFQKALQWEEKYNFGFYFPFIAVILDVQNVQKSKLAEMKSIIRNNILCFDAELSSVLNILIYHLIGEKIEEKHAGDIYNILKKATDNGYLLLAYEVAFVAKTWFDEKRFEDLYRELSEKISHQPVISHIHRQEDWEKSLNLLLGMKSKNGAKSKDPNENDNRVVYYFNPKNNNIQPVLQTRQAKGWSKGRNIAMKTLKNGSAKGMTEQDLRISKHIKEYNDYYGGSSYEFDNRVCIDLIGHPYIFLNNTDDISVEFIAGQVVVSVNKTAKGYQLVSNLKEVGDSIFIQKETNTRYKVYNLTANQMRILEIINEQKIIIPENGKAKLTELLGTLSAEGMEVHSDLVADKNARTEIKELPSDSRIRVQLLPLGDGLKTELFSKPFGERPPYCKPGKGGKVLISNEKDVQLQVKRNLKQETENEQILMNDIQSLESLNENDGLLSFDDPMDGLYLLDILAKRQDVCVVEWPEGEKFKLRGTAGINNLNVNIKSGTNWFDLQGEFRVDENTVLTLQQLLKLTAKSHGRFIELSQGEFLALSDRLKKQLDNLRLFSDEDKKGIHLNKFASVGLGDFFDEMENVKADKAWKDFRKKIEKTKEENTLIPANLQAELRSYQEEGFRWMARLAEWNGGACLADDMGLGKTVQTLAILLHRAQQGAALVVCPVSVIGNWVSEVEKFAPTLRIKTLGVNTTTNRKEVLQSLEAGDVLITSYGLLQSEEKLFSEPEFATVVLDEAHVIKNYATKTSKATMQLKAGFRVALTGTPLQNHLGEIWNLFNFINPGLLGSLQHFNDVFVKSNDEASKKHLKKMIAPFILRRTKSAVLDELPPKTEIVKKIQLSSDEMAFYEALRRQALENLSNADESKHIQVLAEITKLRQASCNPLLIDGNVNIPSSKLATFLDIAGELIANKHRALVFSQFVSHLAIVRKELDKQGIKYKYIDGSTSQAERQRNVKEFQSGDGELFLISLKAGGLGLNLTAADYVIHLDPWWNPAIEDQASDRAHRIGQQRPVTIYRLVAENTIEEKIIQLHTHKRDLAEQLLEGSDMAARLSVGEMVDLIREGAIVGR